MAINKLNEDILRKCRIAYAEMENERERLYWEGHKPLPSPTVAAVQCFLDETGVLSALEEIERHHVEQNSLKGRDEGKSRTLAIARAAIAKARGMIVEKPVIVPVDQAGDHRTGSLSGDLSPEEITAVLGFGPNIPDDASKVTHSWGFSVDGVRCGIWDYKGGRWSTYDPENLLPELFAKARGENAEVAA